MGSKGGAEPPVITQAGGVDPAMMQMMQMMMQQQASLSQQQPQLPQQTAAPTAQTVEKVDWTQKLADLTEQTTAAYNTEQDRTVGRTDTVRTPSLLDDEEVETTSTELGT